METEPTGHYPFRQRVIDTAGDSLRDSLAKAPYSVGLCADPDVLSPGSSLCPMFLFHAGQLSKILLASAKCAEQLRSVGSGGVVRPPPDDSLLSRACSISTLQSQPILSESPRHIHLLVQVAVGQHLYSCTTHGTLPAQNAPILIFTCQFVPGTEPHRKQVKELSRPYANKRLERQEG